MGKLFDTHSWVKYVNEPDAVLLAHGLPYLPKRAEIPSYKEQAARYLADLEAFHTPSTLGKLPLFPKAYRTNTGHRLFQLTVITAKALSKIPGLSRVDRMRIPTFIREGGAEDRSLVPVVKSVVSLCRARLFAEARPGLKIIHIIRHPCGVIASQLRGEQQGKWEAEPYLKAHFSLPEAAAYGMTLEQVRELTLEEQLAFRWMVRNDKVATEMESYQHYRTVRYEDLCSDPRRTMKELFSHAGLTMGAPTEEFIGRLESLDDGDRGYFSVIRSPLRSVDRWKTDLSTAQIERITSLAVKSEAGKLYFPTV